MANVYGTEGRLLEQLALNGELSVSQLARATGLSYPTTLYKISSFPFVAFQKAGREKKVQIRDEDVDAVYPFLIALQTNGAKKAELAMVFLSRKGFSDAILGGELALEAQLPVKDADPDPEIEIRTRDARRFLAVASQLLPKMIESELISNSKIVEDNDVSLTKRQGLLQLSRPEKLLVDAVAEKQSRIFTENVAEAIVNSNKVDIAFLESYARSRGVAEEVHQEIESAKRSGFP